MTSVTGSASDAATPAQSERPGPSLSARRARRLLAGGLAGAHAAALPCIGLFAVFNGPAGLASAALGAALVVLFYTIGKTVQVRYADAAASTLFRASVLSYVARVSLLGVLLVAYLRFAGDTTRLEPLALAVTAVATVVGWLAGEILVFSRLRIPNFDEPSEQAAEARETK